VLLPFLFWANVYYLYLLHHKGDPFAPGAYVREMLQGSATNHLTAHLWFLPMIMGLYLATPVIRRFTDTASERELGYFLAMCLAFASVVPMAEQAFGLKVGLQSPLFTGFIGYFVLGRVLHVRPTTGGTGPLLAYGFLYLAATAVNAYWPYAVHGTEASGPALFGVLAPSGVAATFAVYRIVQCLGQRLPAPSPGVSAGLRSLGGAVFGIYLVHVLVLRLMGRALAKAGLSLPIGTVPLKALAILAISYGIVIAMQRTPVLRRLVP
jgi:surface polysaccharide O-acyltransferase-like enzyme